MAQDFTTTSFLDKIKLKAMIPTNQSTFTDDLLLDIANDEYESHLIPYMMGVREEFFVSYIDVPMVAGSNAYPLPPRAIGCKLRDLTILTGTAEFSIPLLAPEQIFDLKNPFYPLNTALGYFFRGNNVILDPRPASSISTVRMYYFVRPNHLVLTSAAGLISSVDPLTNQVIINNIPATFVVTEKYDFVKGTPNFDTISMDSVPTSVVGATFTFSANGLPTGLAVGDYLCLAQESPVIQLPLELHPLLIQMSVVRVLEALGDANGVTLAERKLEQLKLKIIDVLSPRVEGECKKIINPYSPINGGGRFSRWWTR